jgi:hypothetical protein
VKKITVFFLVGVVALGAAGVYLFGRYEAGGANRIPQGRNTGISLPGVRQSRSVSTGTHSMDILVEKPKAAGVVDATINFSAGRIDAKTADQGSLISGTAAYDDEALKPTLTEDGTTVGLRTGSGSNPISFPMKFDSHNTWNLVLAKGVPMSLHLEVGAAESNIDIGGLDLRDLSIKQGASSFRFAVSEPLTGKLDSLSFEGGASDSRFASLGNTGAKTLSFKAGAGNFDFDFSGDLPRPMSVKIEGGLGNMVIRVPAGRKAVLTKSGFSHVNRQGSWIQDGESFTLPGSGNSLTIEVNMAMGNIELRN